MNITFTDAAKTMPPHDKVLFAEIEHNGQQFPALIVYSSADRNWQICSVGSFKVKRPPESQQLNESISAIVGRVERFFTFEPFNKTSRVISFNEMDYAFYNNEMLAKN